MVQRLLLLCLPVIVVATAGRIVAQIPRPDDAPMPLSPADSQACFRVPQGYSVELIASEPLIREPSGVCWDAAGNFFVCELHGYNLEGQYDVDELNQTGKLDRVVRRLQADEKHKQAAEAETYGTIRQLMDTNGDGLMDQAVVWADRLPPCLGICPVADGLVAACQTQILFLADRNHDGHAEVREAWFEGFEKGPLERSINCPTSGPDNWIYFGSGAGGGTIRGMHLAEPVSLPRTDFRIRPDGSAIEPVVGSTGTMGFAFTESGDRFVISTGTPAIFTAPMAWQDLARNPWVATPRLEERATSDQRCFPISQPHPWRTRRAEDPGFSKYYTDRYGITESAPNGYFTSACSPLVYQDSAMPELHGQLLACEPAQNLVHRGIIRRDGARLTLHRAERESQSEFLASTDAWFHPIALAHAPDGSIVVVDFYREIIEDYSAIPRYLQQQYGLIAGQNHGRIWRLTASRAAPNVSQRDEQLPADTLPDTPPVNMSSLTAEQLVAELGSPRYWRRQTARRLLAERPSSDVDSQISALVQSSQDAAVVHNALAALDARNAVSMTDIEQTLAHPAPSVRRQALQLSERWLREDGGSGELTAEQRARALDAVLAVRTDPEPLVRLQLVLTLGESRDRRVVPVLAELARQFGNEPWFGTATLSSVGERSGQLLAELLAQPAELREARELLAPLCTTIVNRRDAKELSDALEQIARLDHVPLRVDCLRGMESAATAQSDVTLTSAARDAVKRMSLAAEPEVRDRALALFSALNVETAEERRTRLQRARTELLDVQAPAAVRINALARLRDDAGADTSRTLVASMVSGTPEVRDAALAALLDHEDRTSVLLDALAAGEVSTSALSAVQRASLREARNPDIRRRAESLLPEADLIDPELLERYTKALEHPRDSSHGAEVFRTKCAACHQAHGIGHAVGPDLSAEFLRAEETIVRDMLAPSDVISPGYVTYAVVTTSGQVVTGLIASESPTSLTLKQAEGKEITVLRREVEELKALPVSMMPDDLVKTTGPRDLADVLAWIRRPPARLMLLNENPQLIEALSEGDGTAAFVASDAYEGRVCLRVTPFQRYSARIPGWSFPIRQHPAAGEFRYLRFAWKTPAADGVMLEVAADGNWPASDQAIRRYHAGRNTTPWQSIGISAEPPRDWQLVTRDLWQECGDCTITGIAPTALGGPVLFDCIELLQSVDPH